MIKDYLDDYYRLKISLDEICKKEGIVQSTFYRYLERNELLSRRKYYSLIDTGIEELNEKLKIKYSDIVKRCTGKPSYENKCYDGKHYMPIYEWVEFCNSNKGILLKLWDNYIKHNKSLKYSISIDRIDNDKGYTTDNVEFVPYSYNAWKRNVRPIKVTNNNKNRFFMSCEEGSKFYNLGRQTFGKILNNAKYHNRDFGVEHATIEEVLRNNNISDLKQYHERVIEDARNERIVSKL